MQETEGGQYLGNLRAIHSTRSEVLQSPHPPFSSQGHPQGDTAIMFW